MDREIASCLGEARFEHVPMAKIPTPCRLLHLHMADRRSTWLLEVGKDTQRSASSSLFRAYGITELQPVPTVQMRIWNGSASRWLALMDLVAGRSLNTGQIPWARLAETHCRSLSHVHVHMSTQPCVNLYCWMELGSAGLLVLGAGSPLR